ncbi:MAG TPA: tRNA (adenosine(37)-N6)-threonylcarbamoyltransferase complex ATPase subunit type 1 TsaE [Gammaproteobacteria bacterium]|nr:tRNA (adenosine(37)-N6)-threonylcarbamoyltransferase complex ATPase subunit type 1 TsaE [Gammaproteobacteria bacterium]
MGESILTLDFRTEAELSDFAGAFGRRALASGPRSLLLGLAGDLGAGKTTWVRGLLRGLGHAGRVPSPTYTLLEPYRIGALTLVHLDLYRLADERELENLGLRDWLAEPSTWVVVEWPERAPGLAATCDVLLTLGDLGGTGRRMSFSARTGIGIEALRAGYHPSSK